MDTIKQHCNIDLELKSFTLFTSFLVLGIISVLKAVYENKITESLEGYLKELKKPNRIELTEGT